MDNLNFYIVPDDYVTYLQQSEIEKRGFTRIPNMNYGEKRKPKFLCGIVLEINDVNFFVPVSSFKKQMPDNYLICDKKNNVVASLRFNYMFPVPLEIIKERRIDTETDFKYKALLSQELKYCVANQDNIRRIAKRTYKRVMIRKNETLLNNSCDFKLLEQKCQEYQTMKQQPILPNQILRAQNLNEFTQSF